MTDDDDSLHSLEVVFTVHYAAEPGDVAEGRIAIDIYLKKAAASRAAEQAGHCAGVRNGDGLC